jgi:hypothetical protein
MKHLHVLGTAIHRVAVVVVLVLVLAACASQEDVPVVPRPTPSPTPAAHRFEVVETAVVASGAEISIPIASTEPGVQTIEAMFVSVTPDSPNEMIMGAEGSRFLKVHATSAGETKVEVTYRVERSEVRVDFSKEEVRPLSDFEKRVLKAELEVPVGTASEAWTGKTTEFVHTVAGRPGGVETLRASGVAARRVFGVQTALAFSSPQALSAEWVEAFVPGIGWVGFRHDLGVLPDDLFTLSRDPSDLSWRRSVEFQWKELAER